MTVIAHITDVHLVEPEHAARTGTDRARLSYLSFGRPINYEDRMQRFARALEGAWGSGADHVLITGDLTEDGTDEQFEVLALVLGESRLRPEQVTLIPGNHDAYVDATAWQRALEGPLSPYARTSAKCSVLEFREATILPVSTAFHQSWLRSAGQVAADEIEWVARVAADPCFSRRPLVVAQHHPPLGCPVPVLQWVDGLQNHASMRSLLGSTDHMFVVHGHTHRRTDRRLGGKGPMRIFGAEAVVESKAPLRLYEACPTGLVPVADESGVGAGMEVLVSA
jgi:3',5'-cyclic AMP phosphodiesterase CpdA